MWGVGSKGEKKRKKSEAGRRENKYKAYVKLTTASKQTQMIVNIVELLQRQYETSLYWKQSSGERRKKNLPAASLPYPVSPRSKSAPQGFNPLTLLGV